LRLGRVAAWLDPKVSKGKRRSRREREAQQRGAGAEKSTLIQKRERRERRESEES
jgi:hypothetical protein